MRWKRKYVWELRKYFGMTVNQTFDCLQSFEITRDFWRDFVS